MGGCGGGPRFTCKFFSVTGLFLDFNLFASSDSKSIPIDPLLIGGCLVGVCDCCMGLSMCGMLLAPIYLNSNWEKILLYNFSLD